jgi:DNA-binding NarL/FixJ family response regulator
VRTEIEQRYVNALRGAFGERQEALKCAWDAGRGMNLQGAANVAREMDEALPMPEPLAAPGALEPVASSLLTAREMEVATLIAAGKTSKEIAEDLVSTERTADTHAAHIRDKLGVRSRAEIAVWAVRQGLLPPNG